jgi:hypothetical protein
MTPNHLIAWLVVGTVATALFKWLRILRMTWRIRQEKAQWRAFQEQRMWTPERLQVLRRKGQP